MRLKEILPKPWSRLILISLGVLALLLPAAAPWAAPCDIKNNAPPLIRHDLSASYCELCSYGHITVVVANPYEGVDMTAMMVVEDLRSSGLTFHASAPDAVRYRVNGGPLQVGGAPAVGGTSGSLLDATVLMEPDIPYDYLVQVMDAVRGTEIRDEETDGMQRMILFPEISIGDAP